MAKSLTAKRAERSDLKAHETITVNLTISASQHNMQCLAALMSLQDPTRPALPDLDSLGPLPFDEKPAPNPQPLELDYNMIRNEIMGLLPKYVERMGKPALKALIETHEGQTLKTVPEENLLDLLADVKWVCDK